MAVVATPHSTPYPQNVLTTVPSSNLVNFGFPLQIAISTISGKIINGIEFTTAYLTYSSECCCVPSYGLWNIVVCS